MLTRCEAAYMCLFSYIVQAEEREERRDLHPDLQRSISVPSSTNLRSWMLPEPSSTVARRLALDELTPLTMVRMFW